MLLLSLILCLALVAQCQWFHAGVKGGLSLTPDQARGLTTGRNGGTEFGTRVNRGSFGPYIEFTPFRRFPGLETGFLYKRLRTDTYFGPFPNAALNYITRTATLLELPLLIKWRHRSVFAAAGSTLRRSGDYEQKYRFIPLFPGFDSTDTTSRVASDPRFLYGATVSAGLSLQLSRFHVEPEIRFTRWTAIRDVPRQNQVDLLLGIIF